MAQQRWRTRWDSVGRAAVTAALLAGLANATYAAEAPLAAAQKALKSGKPAVAVNTLTAALAGAGLKGGDIARAYYLRGLAQVKSGNPAAAIADLNHALWLKGLSDSERADATSAKVKLYQQAGLGAPAAAPALAAAVDTAEVPPNPAEYPVSVEAAAAGDATWGSKAAAAEATVKHKSKKKGAPSADSAARAPAAPENLPWTYAPATPPAPKVVATSGDNPVNSVLGNLFGSAPPAEPVTAAVSAPTPDTVVASKAPETPTPPTAKSVAVLAKTGVFVQVASLRTSKEAEDVAARLTTDHAALMSKVSTRVTPVVLGNMGTFYAVQVGPVATATAGEGLCKKLRSKSVDCFVATP